MKNILKKTSDVLAIFMLTWVFLMACNTGDSSVKPQATGTSVQSAKWCHVYVIPGVLKFNHRSVGWNCYYNPFMICYRPAITIRIPCFYPIDWWKDCWVCGPWDIFKRWRDEIIIPDFREQLKWAGIDPREGGVMFPANQVTIGLQFYEKTDMMDGEILTLKEDTELDAETAKALGVNAKMISAGQYPVQFDEKNQTFNALVSVK